MPKEALCFRVPKADFSLLSRLKVKQEKFELGMVIVLDPIIGSLLWCFHTNSEKFDQLPIELFETKKISEIRTSHLRNL